MCQACHTEWERAKEREGGEREREKSQAHFYAHLQFAIFRLKSVRITELPGCQTVLPTFEKKCKKYIFFKKRKITKAFIQKRA